MFDAIAPLMVGETATPTYTITPAITEVSKVWSTDRPDLVSIDPVTGVITALAEGVAVVTLTVNRVIVGSVGVNIYPYVSVVAPTNLTVTQV